MNNEKSELSLYDLDEAKFIELMNDEFSSAIKENRYEIIDEEKTVEMLNNLNIDQSFKFNNYTHVEKIVVGFKSCYFNIVSRWTKDQMDYIIELAKKNNIGTNYDVDIKKLNEMGNTNYTKQNVNKI